MGVIFGWIGGWSSWKIREDHLRICGDIIGRKSVTDGQTEKQTDR